MMSSDRRDGGGTGGSNAIKVKREDRDREVRGSRDVETRGSRADPLSSATKEDSSHRKDRERSPRRRNRGNPGKFSHENSSGDAAQRRFVQRNRLFVGNVSKDVTQEDFLKLFVPYGEISEAYVSEKGFGFVTLASRSSAEAAKAELDNRVINGRSLRVRFAQHNAALRLKELPPFATNELLAEAFTIFGEVERAIHFVDEKGRPTGEGLVEFARRPMAIECLRRVNEGIFLLSMTPKPIRCELVENVDQEDGLIERMLLKKGDYQKEREVPPRFASHGQFEYEFGQRWKDLYAEERLRREALEREFQSAREQLAAQMDMAYEEYQAQHLREELRRRQEELERLEQGRMERLEKLRRYDEERGNRYGSGMNAGRGGDMYSSRNGPQLDAGIGLSSAGPSASGNGIFGNMHDPSLGYVVTGDRERDPNNLVHGVQKLVQMMGKKFADQQQPLSDGGFGVGSMPILPSMNAPMVDMPQSINSAGAFGIGFGGIEGGFPGLNSSAFENPGTGGLEEEYGHRFDDKGDRRGYNNRDRETFHPSRNRDDERSRRRGDRY